MTQRQILSAWILAALVLVALGGAGTANAQGAEAYFADSAITARVKVAINNDAGLSEMDISIETQDKVVRLGGFVSSMTAMGRAIALARAVEGVTAVRNMM